MNAIDRLKALREENDLVSATMEINRDRFERLRDRHTNGTAPQVVTGFNLFPTPEHVAKRMAELLELENGQSLLEPSAGTGNLIRQAQQLADLEITAVEESKECAASLFQHFPTVRLWQRDFLTVEPEPFDRILMNPPFHMRADLRHIAHARKFLAPDGVLIGLCMAGPIREKALRDQCESWEVLPSGTFAGTKVETILFKIRA